MRASRSGGNVLDHVGYGAVPASAVNDLPRGDRQLRVVHRGQLRPPASGSATIALPDNVWFLVAATDGASTDGSYARAIERQRAELRRRSSPPVRASPTHVTNNACP